MFSFVPGIEINLVVKRNIRGNVLLFCFALWNRWQCSWCKRPVCGLSSRSAAQYFAVDRKSLFHINLVWTWGVRVRQSVTAELLLSSLIKAMNLLMVFTLWSGKSWTISFYVLLNFLSCKKIKWQKFHFYFDVIWGPQVTIRNVNGITGWNSCNSKMITHLYIILLRNCMCEYFVWLWRLWICKENYREKYWFEFINIMVLPGMNFSFRAWLKDLEMDNPIELEYIEMIAIDSFLTQLSKSVECLSISGPI